jgi:hypothetical protein
MWTQIIAGLLFGLVVIALASGIGMALTVAFLVAAEAESRRIRG